MSLYAVGAGLMGCLGSISAKFAFDSEKSSEICHKIVASLHGAGRSSDELLFNSEGHEQSRCTQPLISHESLTHFNAIGIIRLVALSVFVYSNLQMWRLHSHSLSRADSSAQSVLINSATNFVASGLAGMLLFGEIHGLSWWFGLSLILAGTAVIHFGAMDKEKENNERIKKNS